MNIKKYRFFTFFVVGIITTPPLPEHITIPAIQAFGEIAYEMPGVKIYHSSDQKNFLYLLKHFFPCEGSIIIRPVAAFRTQFLDHEFRKEIKIAFMDTHAPDIHNIIFITFIFDQGKLTEQQLLLAVFRFLAKSDSLDNCQDNPEYLLLREQCKVIEIKQSRKDFYRDDIQLDTASSVYTETSESERKFLRTVCEHYRNPSELAKVTQYLLRGCADLGLPLKTLKGQDGSLYAYLENFFFVEIKPSDISLTGNEFDASQLLLRSQNWIVYAPILDKDSNPSSCSTVLIQPTRNVSTDSERYDMNLRTILTSDHKHIVPTPVTISAHMNHFGLLSPIDEKIINPDHDPVICPGSYYDARASFLAALGRLKRPPLQKKRYVFKSGMPPIQEILLTLSRKFGFNYTHSIDSIDLGPVKFVLFSNDHLFMFVHNGTEIAPVHIHMTNSRVTFNNPDFDLRELLETILRSAIDIKTRDEGLASCTDDGKLASELKETGLETKDITMKTILELSKLTSSQKAFEAQGLDAEITTLALILFGTVESRLSAESEFNHALGKIFYDHQPVVFAKNSEDGNQEYFLKLSEHFLLQVADNNDLGSFEVADPKSQERTLFDVDRFLRSIFQEGLSTPMRLIIVSTDKSKSLRFRPEFRLFGYLTNLATCGTVYPVIRRSLTGMDEIYQTSDTGTDGRRTDPFYIDTTDTLQIDRA